MSTPFNLKAWLDQHVVPLLAPELLLHSVLTNLPPGAPGPQAVLVWLLAREPAGWAPALKRVLERPGFSFDFLRAPQRAGADLQHAVTLFGGDGAPFFNQSGAAMARLYRRCDDLDLIVEIGHRFPSVQAAAAAVKSFFALFEGVNAFDVIERHKPPFGLA
jgi:hypothetical protein